MRVLRRYAKGNQPGGIITPVLSAVHISSQEAFRRIRQLQVITIAWMVVEAAISLWAARDARSPALATFGGDSVIELLSAAVVLWRFRTGASEPAEKVTARVAGGLLFALSAFVIFASAMSLRGFNKPKPSSLGMMVLMAAALIMPLLAREKRRLSALTGSAALRADAAESALCGYMSIIALIGLAAHAIWHVSWADPIAALAITPFILFEAREAMHGKACCG